MQRGGRPAHHRKRAGRSLEGRPSSSLTVGVDYEEAIESAEPLADADSEAGPELMFYTSGTTARPKGVSARRPGDRSGLGRGLEGQVALVGLDRRRRLRDQRPAPTTPPISGGHSVRLFVGATVVITEQFEARAFLAEVSLTGGTRSFMVPAHFIRILEIPEDERAAMDSLQLLPHRACSGALSGRGQVQDDGSLPQTEIHELYGASEGGATRISPDEWRARPGSVGLPWPGVEIRILDETGEPVATGESGIIYINPPGHSRFSYRNDQEATDRAWHDDAFTVGDIGHLDEDGYLTITDRVSDMVLWGGVNIAPAR